MNSAADQIKILIATGVYPPDLGGPATYAAALSPEFRRLGNEVKIITFGATERQGADGAVFFVSRTGNILARYWKFFWQVWRQAAKADVIYILDLMSVGLPATVAAALKGRKIVFRTGGDFLWEKAFQNGWTEWPLVTYYQNQKSYQEKLLMSLCRWILRRLDLVVFSTELQARLYHDYYDVPLAKSVILANALPEVKIGSRDEKYKDAVIFAGRLIKIKNLERLVKAFGKIDQTRSELLIFGDGPEKNSLQKLILELGAQGSVKLMGRVGREELMNIIAASRFFILPSLTEISPNLALECLALAKPVILTKETGLDAALTRELVKIDPLSEEDLRAKIDYLLNDDNLAAYENKMRQLDIPWRSWRQVAEEHLEVFRRVLKA